MSNELAFTNTLGLPQELVPIMINNLVCEYSSLKKHGTPITMPLIPFPGEDGRTIDINTGLTYPSKAERARNNPRVCLLYSEPKGTAIENPPTILVYGHATVHDSDLQKNTDRYVQSALTLTQMFRIMPRFIFRQLNGYLARIWISVTPLKVLWWPEGDTEKTPQQWLAPEGTQAPPSDPQPKRLSTRHKPLVVMSTDWSKEITYALEHLGDPILTVVDAEGYPVPFRARSGSLVSEGLYLDLPSGMPVEAQGRGCLTFHSLQVKNGEMTSNENMSFSGNVSRDGDHALFRVKRQLPGASFKTDLSGMLSMGKFMLSLKKRLEAEAERRGQPVPKVRFPGEY